MQTRYFSNNSSTTITSDNGATIVVASAANLPTQFPYFVTAENASLVREIIRVDSASGTTLNVTRAQEGTTQVAFVAGNRIEQRVTAQLLNDVVAGVNASVQRSGDTLSGALNFAPQVTLASAATVNIGAASANTVNISGNSSITSFGTVAAGLTRRVVFQSVLTLTYNATSLILPSKANITTATDDSAIFESLGSGSWRCLSYQKADGTAIVQPPSGVTSFNGRTGAVSLTSTEVGTACVNIGTGGVGSYGLFFSPAITAGAGNLAAGGSLTYADTSGGASGSPAGTWRCHGWVSGTASTYPVTLWQRIA